MPEARIDAIVGALTGAASDASLFEAHFRGLGAFPSAARPRVVWAGVAEGATEMITLAGRVNAALEALGFAPEARPFSPHVTLGRVRQPGRSRALTDALGSAATREFGRMPVPGASLMRSELSPSGARYTELASVRLGRRV